jgi:hypothetical protein
MTMVALRREDEALTTVARPRRAGPARPPVRLRASATAPLPLVRRDTLPENADYADTGCDLFASCLRCPLARCRYDAPPGGLRRLVTEARDREIALIRRHHRAPIDALAATYGLTRRSIFRILSEQREAEPPSRVGAHRSVPVSAPDPM